ncbi:hypothetical protein MIT9_P1570 [Methylomarinovum caldicuralii]|uniref:Uncharacterized protein n=1 Tax=Methylomarinovum caldicuralii TaxID=438856 RepID=A0AAU9C2X6_9GAMM|nr:hypothetical protein MIT9_P1570 [Methylomarinovum caldicuralii]
MKLRPYPEYKDSGVSWLEEIPATWRLQRLRNAVELKVSNVDKHIKDTLLPTSSPFS